MYLNINELANSHFVTKDFSTPRCRALEGLLQKRLFLNLQKSPFAVSYLINTCGFSPEKAASASKFLNFQSREKPDLMIEFFKKQGFSQTQASRVMTYPKS
ncbi:hypothetical protein L6164_029948 [Bauhinia variegata]|uniref:Uncharacterized protein n=1 Tax=Bauhinia variegata TaxID=167791 RepID=A0ACB9LAW6_BAUVA|nr:hypothetical protein L6164_029948 [Bauhinia variegata]